MFFHWHVTDFRHNRLVSGAYAGFDTSEPTSESGGKPRVVKLLKEKFGHKSLVMIGDGATDMEASPPAVRIYIYDTM